VRSSSSSTTVQVGVFRPLNLPDFVLATPPSILTQSQ
jgi:hypothetical protein